jgi:hypothetical protein
MAFCQDIHDDGIEDVPTEVLRESRLLTWWMIGPKTRGGLMVTPSKFGLSSLMNFQNAFSARVLEAGPSAEKQAQR